MTDYTNNNPPITPPLKLFREWTKYRGTECEDQFWWRIATQAARWGADCELDACCAWLAEMTRVGNQEWPKNLRASRRPKPPSHKELALIALTALEACAAQSSDTTESVYYIRRALEQLDD